MLTVLLMNNFCSVKHRSRASDSHGMADGNCIMPFCFSFVFSFSYDTWLGSQGLFRSTFVQQCNCKARRSKRRSLCSCDFTLSICSFDAFSAESLVRAFLRRRYVQLHMPCRLYSCTCRVAMVDTLQQAHPFSRTAFATRPSRIALRVRVLLVEAN